ncbi:MAG: hypothetical protein EBX67_07330 [Betaproteobacteria bacterium]|nr:hypothetical protein [Betaproteobacteria bacterium]
MDWWYFIAAELLFFVLFVLFFIWQYGSLQKDKALLKAQREAEAEAERLGANAAQPQANERPELKSHE